MPERVSAIAKAERRIDVLEEKIGVLFVGDVCKLSHDVPVG